MDQLWQPFTQNAIFNHHTCWKDYSSGILYATLVKFGTYIPDEIVHKTLRAEFLKIILEKNYSGLFWIIFKLWIWIHIALSRSRNSKFGSQRFSDWLIGIINTKFHDYSTKNGGGVANPVDPINWRRICCYRGNYTRDFEFSFWLFYLIIHSLYVQSLVHISPGFLKII